MPLPLGDGELAELLMRRHIAASRRNIERHYQGANATVQPYEVNYEP